MSIDAGPLAWLMIIDMQRVFGEPDSPWFTPGFDKVSAAALRLRAAFGSRVVLTRFVPPDHPQGAWIPYYRRSSFALEPANAGLFDLMPAFPVDGSIVIDRPTFSKWDAGAQVRLGGSEVVLAGVSTDCCVLSTALAAVDAGMHGGIVADACAGVDARSHRCAIDVMALYAPQIEITSVDAVLARRHRDRVHVSGLK